MTRYMRWLEAERGRSFGDYQALWEWSVGELEEFWASIWDFFEVDASAPYSEVLPDRVMPGARWFAGAELSYAQHIFRGKRDTDLAVLHASELRPLGELRWGELREQVARVAAGLRGLGVERGDRVVAYMPNVPETLVAFLATASLGAIWSSCSPDFGASSVVDRFAQIEPKVMFCVDGYRYNGKDFDRTETVVGTAAADADARAHRRRSLPRPRARPLAPGKRRHLGRAAGGGRGRGASIRAGAVRPSALGPVLVWDHRPAEGDRAGPRRDPAGAPEEAPPPRRRAG